MCCNNFFQVSRLTMNFSFITADLSMLYISTCIIKLHFFPSVQQIWGREISTSDLKRSICQLLLGYAYIDHWTPRISCRSLYIAASKVKSARVMVQSFCSFQDYERMICIQSSRSSMKIWMLHLFLVNVINQL